MILADTAEDRQRALDRLLPIQREDFAGIFRAMAPRPVTIRLLDPPMHEFLPSERSSSSRTGAPAPPARNASMACRCWTR